ncbi:MAG: 4Fe-4S dicluster domain-containing protein [candidate division KSB1 bacterium]|jgi:molybdopterin-containing oxidoreductase family iron-sulfur binding subunit|nr:4Fe-4S dicluster domain-containing protein [candidate division KSB1 bacterium]
MQRRDFIKILGLASGASLMNSCGAKKGAEKLIPHVIPPEIEIIPGQAIYFNTTCTECPANCGVSAKVVEKTIDQQLERYPVKLDGIKNHPVNDGKLCIRGQSSLTRLYDPERLKSPLMKDENGEMVECTWDDAFTRILEALKNSDKKHAYISSRTTGTLSSLIDTFCNRLNIQRLKEFEIFSYATLREAHKVLFDRYEVPSYSIDEADFLLTIGADIFETHGNPVSHMIQYAKARKKGMKWTHVEPHVSLTGLQADQRMVLNPESELYLLLYLARQLAGNRLTQLPDPGLDRVVQSTGLTEEQLKDITTAFQNASRPLLLIGEIATSSEHGLEVAVLSGLIQWTSGMMERGIDFNHSLNYDSVGTFRDLKALAWQLQNQDMGVLFMSKVDPVDKHPISFYLKENLSAADLVVGLSDFMPVLSDDYDIILPLSHSLESWGDAETRKGMRTIVQPVLEPLHNTLCEGDILLKILEKRSGRALAPNFQEYLFARLKRTLSNDKVEALLDQGYVETSTPVGKLNLNLRSVRRFLRDITLPQLPEGMVLIATPSLKSFDGRSRQLELLNEIPDPLTTITHDDWVSISEGAAKERGIKEGNVISIAVGDKRIMELPVKIQPFLSDHVVMVQRHMLDTFALSISDKTGDSINYLSRLTMQKTGSNVDLAIMAGSLSQEGRGVIPNPAHHDAHHHVEGRKSLYPEHAHENYRWAMAIDLDLCVGCSACVAACYIENNIGVVGKEEHLKGREMSWIRIEPYYEEDGTAHFLPMMCQHCDYAPCEAVCPAYAPYHNPEGLNVQVYNRCIGTRYCSNNCPYKVRRFNWKTHEWTDPQNRGLNPEMWARPKGVMEKCTFCIQRIRFAKDKAKDENRLVRDGEVVPACAQACPTNAIVFGNIMDKESEVYKWAHSDRVFRVSEHLGTEPSVYYLQRKRDDHSDHA